MSVWESLAQTHQNGFVRVRGVFLTNAVSRSSGSEGSVFESVYITGSELSFSVIESNGFKGPESIVVDFHVEISEAEAIGHCRCGG